MKFYVGTSGYSYKEWKGSFYPADLPDKDMLVFYGQKLNSVEINNTFYRLPNTSLLAGWNAQVPDGFRFALKASRKITHSKPLKEKAEETAYLFETIKSMGSRLGAILFQLPPYLRKDVELLTNFLQLIPVDFQAAFEFRHHSWFDAEVYALLRSKNVALCCADTDEEDLSNFIATANWGYLRLRKPDYGESDLKHWIKKIKNENWREVYVFFKHEDEGAGPKLAGQFNALIEK